MRMRSMHALVVRTRGAISLTALKVNTIQHACMHWILIDRVAKHAKARARHDLCLGGFLSHVLIELRRGGGCVIARLIHTLLVA